MSARRSLRRRRRTTVLLLPLLCIACRAAEPEEEPHAFGSVRARAPAVLAGSAAGPSNAAPPRTPAAPLPDRDASAPDSTEDTPEHQRELRVDAVIQRLALPRDALVGNVGCGAGVFALSFAKACPSGTVYASDVDPAKLERLGRRADERELCNVVPVLASRDDPRFPAASLDCVFLCDAYRRIGDRVAYMQRLKESLRAGGRVALLEYKSGRLPVGPPAEEKLPEGTMDREMMVAGYVLIDRFTTHAWHDFEVWRPRRPWDRTE
jgi:precorrin-6B methylase 2